MMNKVKSPLVKVLRKAGYSVKDAMNITMDAQYNYQNQNELPMTTFNHLSQMGGIDCMFVWDGTGEGHRFWSDVYDAVNSI